MYRRLTDKQILAGFQRGDTDILQEYFYGYCREGYYAMDRRYDLRHKQNLDCLSLTHQYAIYLLEHNWKPLEDRAPSVSLKTWIIGGFRYVVLDALKWYRKEYGTITFEDYLQSFYISSDLRQQFRKTVTEMCDTCQMDRRDRLIVLMILERGFKGKDVAAQMGLTPSAISQRYQQLKKNMIISYFREHFDMDLEAPVVIDLQEMFAPKEMELPTLGAAEQEKTSIARNMEQKRTTPEFITHLAPNEIFVFGSNLRGMHGGGAAYVALRKFGAVMGQGVGLQGQSYAIPTMQGGVETIRPYVDEFIQFARENPNLTFLVTRIGCGIAGFTDEEIAPLFAEAHNVGNIVLPAGW